MARSRNIKPGFFANDVLAQCSHGARLVFVGLWTLADRSGRLEDRPLKIKGQLFPYENCDMEQWLSELHAAGFITRYAFQCCKYIQVNNFEKHQNPHCKEPESTIPAPDLHGTSISLAPERSNQESGISNQESGINHNRESTGLPKIDNPILKRAKKEKSKFTPPTVEEVAAYCKERDNDLDPQAWFDYWQSVGWKRKGNKSLEDWRATLRHHETSPYRVKKKLNYCPTLEEARKVWTPAYNPDHDERFQR